MANYTSNYTGRDLDNSIKLSQGSIANEFSAAQSYVVGDFVIYSGDLYKCKTDTSGAWDVSKWDRVKALNEVKAKQDTLVSGTNIKTINSQSILGSGNIEIQGGSGLSKIILEYDSDTQTWNYTAAQLMALFENHNNYLFYFNDSEDGVLIPIPVDEVQEEYDLMGNLNYNFPASAMTGNELDSSVHVVNALTVSFTVNSSEISAPQVSDSMSGIVNAITYSSSSGYNVSYSIMEYLAYFLANGMLTKAAFVLADSQTSTFEHLDLSGIEPIREGLTNLVFANDKKRVKVGVNTETETLVAPIIENLTSQVSVNQLGTSQNTVNYITIDGTEYKLPTGGSGGSDPIVENAKATGGIGWTASVSEILTWNGDPTGHPTWYDGYGVLLSTNTPTQAEVIGCPVSISVDGTVTSYTVASENIVDASEIGLPAGSGYYISFDRENDEWDIIVMFEEISIEGITAPKGISFTKVESSYTRFATSFAYTTNVKHLINNQYITRDSVLQSAEDVKGIGFDTVANQQTIEWDGDTTGKHNVGNMYKVSNSICSWKAFNEGILYGTNGEQIPLSTAAAAGVLHDDGTKYYINQGTDYVLVCYSANDTYQVGTYFCKDPDEDYYYNKFVTKETTKHKIASAYVESLDSAVSNKGIGWIKNSASIDWDGNAEGKPTLLFDENFILVDTENIPSDITQLYGGTYTLTSSSGSNTVVISSENAVEFEGIVIMIENPETEDEDLYIFKEDYMGMVSKGIYFRKGEAAGETTVTNLTLPEIVNKIDSKFLSKDPKVDSAIQNSGFGWDGSDYSLSWDGTGDLLMEEYHKVSSTPIPQNLLVGSVATLYDGDTSEDVTITQAKVQLIQENLYAILPDSGYSIIDALVDTEYEGTAIPAGIYFSKDTEEGSYVSKLVTPSVVHKINSKYIEGGGGGSQWEDLPERPAWDTKPGTLAQAQADGFIMVSE